MKMIFEIVGNIIKSLEIIGGCPGNTAGVSFLVRGRTVEEVINIAKRITGVDTPLFFGMKRYRKKLERAL